jgi:hypothetical protein
MILQGNIQPFRPPAAALAHFVMSTEDSGNRPLKDMLNPEPSNRGKPVLFKPDELDIFCNKVTLDAYIFHGKDVDYESIDRLEYNHRDFSVDVFLKDGTVLDLGVKIQWLVRPYFSKTDQVQIVKTKDNVAIDGTIVPLLHVKK